MAEKDIRIGRRVRVRDATEPSHRSFGRIVPMLTDVRPRKRRSFVGATRGKVARLARDEHRRAEQLDFAD